MTHLSSLQVLSAICSSVRSFLGPDQRMKFIHGDEDDDRCLISSCSELLCNLEVEHPVGRVAVEASLAHQKSHGTGTTTMMTMAGLWATEIQSLITQGIPIPAIIKYGDECVEQCLSSLECIQLPCTKLFEMSDTERVPDVTRQTNTSPRWSSNCGIHSSTKEQFRIPDQFAEGRFSCKRQHQSTSGPAKNELRANLSGINLLKDSAHEMQDDDDDISWYFEGNSQTEEYSLEQHKSVCEAVFKALDRGTCAKATESLTENATGRTLEDDSDDEFDSCFPLEDQDVVDRPTKNVHGKSSLGDGDDDLDSCLSLAEEDIVPIHMDNSLRKPTPDNSDDEFDSCFPPVGHIIMTKESTKGDDSNMQQTSPSDKSLEEDKMVKVDVSMCNVEVTSEDHSTRTKFQSAILEPIQMFLNTNQETRLSKQLGRVHNNSRHFRSLETVMDQLVRGAQSTSSGCHSNGAVSEIVVSEGDKGLSCATVASQTTSKGDTNVHPISSLAEPGNSRSASTKPKEHLSGMREMMEDLLKVRANQTTARTLDRVQYSSRHFRTMESAAAQSVTQEMDVTSGQGLIPEVTLATTEESDEHQRISSSTDGHQGSRLSGNDFSGTRINTATNLKDVNDTDEQKIRSIEQLGFGLSHGSDLEMRLVIEAFKMQMDEQGMKDGTRVPDLNRLNVCMIPGPPVSASHLQAGLLLPVDEYQRGAIEESAGKRLKALLVNGDATPTFKHAGYKNKVKRTTVHTWTGIPSMEEKSWLRELGTLLQELDVKVLLLKGHADEHLSRVCLSEKILLLQDVPYKSLLALGEACGAPILTYLTDATVEDAACRVHVACWESGRVETSRLTREGLKRKLFVRICVDGKVLQTAVLCHPVCSLLPAPQTRFWTSAHRLQGAAADGCFLPGAGCPEQTAIKQLWKLNELIPAAGYRDNLFCFKASIVSSFAEGFILYLIQVLKNMGKLDDTSLAKTCIVSGLHKDKLEPALNGVDLLDGTLNPTSYNWPAPAKSSENQFAALISTPGGSLVSNSLQFESSQAKCPFKTTSSSNSTTDAAIEVKDCLTSSRDETSVSCDGIGVIYDSYTGKKAAWENAWSLLKTVLLIDCHIATGVQGSDKFGSSSSFGQLVIL